MNEQSFNVAPGDMTAIACEECGNEGFRPIVFLRKISRFISPDGQEHIVPLESMECAKCNHINKEFNPIPKKEKENDK
jgi:hypothetical protein